jgi:5-methylthioribose kinase
MVSRMKCGLAGINRAVLTEIGRNGQRNKLTKFLTNKINKKMEVFDKCFPKTFWQKYFSKKLLAEKF